MSLLSWLICTTPRNRTLSKIKISGIFLKANPVNIECTTDDTNNKKKPNTKNTEHPIKKGSNKGKETLLCYDIELVACLTTVLAEYNTSSCFQTCSWRIVQNAPSKIHQETRYFAKPVISITSTNANYVATTTKIGSPGQCIHRAYGIQGFLAARTAISSCRIRALWNATFGRSTAPAQPSSSSATNVAPSWKLSRVWNVTGASRAESTSCTHVSTALSVPPIRPVSRGTCWSVTAWRLILARNTRAINVEGPTRGGPIITSTSSRYARLDRCSVASIACTIQRSS